MSACRALGRLTGQLDDVPALVNLAWQDDGRLVLSRGSKGTPSTNVGSVTWLLDDAPALVHLAVQNDGHLTVSTVSTVSKGTVSTKRPTERKDGSRGTAMLLLPTPASV